MTIKHPTPTSKQAVQGSRVVQGCPTHGTHGEVPRAKLATEGITGKKKAE